MSDEWEKNELSHSDKLAERYPFYKDFSEVIADLTEWKEHLNKKLFEKGLPRGVRYYMGNR